MVDVYPDRILSEGEIENVRQLLLRQELDYPNYETWVEDTIKEIKEGKKRAFGLFGEQLIGDCVIRETASGTVELKNFFIREESRGNLYGPVLYNYVEDYCRKHGLFQIQVDMFIDQPRIIQFFIKHGFEFQARGDFHGAGKESYLLVKRIPPRYNGEYDWTKISRWVIENLWRHRFVKKADGPENIYQYVKNEGGLVTPITFFISDNLNDQINEQKLLQFMQSNMVVGAPYCFAPFFSDDGRHFASERGIVLVDHDKLEQLSGYDLPRSYGDIAGYIVIIKPEYFDRLLDRRDRVFIKNGGIPSGLEKGHVLVFYVSSPIKAVRGFTVIQDISNYPPSELWGRHSRQSAFTEPEYQAYTQGRTETTAYSFDEIKTLSTQIGIDEIRGILGSFNHQAGQKITVDEWGRLRQ